MLDLPICMWITDIDRVTDSISLTLFLSSPEPCCFVILDGLCVLSIKSAIDVVDLIALETSPCTCFSSDPGPSQGQRFCRVKLSNESFKVNV